MLSRKLLKTALLASLLMSPAAKAVDIFGYFTFDYSELMTGDTGKKDVNGKPVGGTTGQAGNFDNQFLSLMIQHEQGIYKFFSEVEFLFGPEMVLDPANGTGVQQWGKGSPAPGSGIIVERAYVDSAYSSMFNLRVGKSLAPLLWKANHYPNIVKPITMPDTLLNATLPTGFIGPMLFGKISHGLSYNLWTGRSAADGSSSGNSTGSQAYTRMFRLAYENELAGANFEISVVGGNYEKDSVTKTPMGADISLNMGKFSMWAEYSQSGEDNTTLKKLRDGGYVVLSYAMMADGKELTPYLFYDTYNDSSSGFKKATSALGLNYRPTGTVEHKAEYSMVAQSKTDKSVVDEARLNYQFVYFFN